MVEVLLEENIVIRSTFNGFHRFTRRDTSTRAFLEVAHAGEYVSNNNSITSTSSLTVRQDRQFGPRPHAEVDSTYKHVPETPVTKQRKQQQRESSLMDKELKIL